MTNVQPKRKRVAITLDDGPHHEYTPSFLEFANSLGVKLTFFVVGERVSRNRHVLRDAVEAGHEIGNHSWSHPNFIHLSDEAFRGEVQRTDAIIFDATGCRTTLFRPPYGAITQAQTDWLTCQLSYRIVRWNVDSQDWRKPGAEQVASQIIANTRDCSIVLLHDIYQETLTAFRNAALSLISADYTFLTVSQLHRSLY